jgi:hypothetical protein
MNFSSYVSRFSCPAREPKFVKKSILREREFVKYSILSEPEFLPNQSRLHLAHSSLKSVHIYSPSPLHRITTEINCFNSLDFACHGRSKSIYPSRSRWSLIPLHSPRPSVPSVIPSRLFPLHRTRRMKPATRTDLSGAAAPSSRATPGPDKHRVRPVSLAASALSLRRREGTTHSSGEAQVEWRDSRALVRQTNSWHLDLLPSGSVTGVPNFTGVLVFAVRRLTVELPYVLVLHCCYTWRPGRCRRTL